jgi:hypothetical protein
MRGGRVEHIGPSVCISSRRMTGREVGSSVFEML